MQHAMQGPEPQAVAPGTPHRRFREVPSFWRHAWTDAGPDAADARPAEASLDVLQHPCVLCRREACKAACLLSRCKAHTDTEAAECCSQEGSRAWQDMWARTGTQWPSRPQAGWQGAARGPPSNFERFGVRLGLGQCAQMAQMDHGKGGCQGQGSELRFCLVFVSRRWLHRSS